MKQIFGAAVDIQSAADTCPKVRDGPVGSGESVGSHESVGVLMCFLSQRRPRDWQSGLARVRARGG